MRRVARTGIAVTLVLAGWLTPARARVTVDVPLLIEFDVCVLPSKACGDPRDVAALTVAGRRLQAAITDVRVLTADRTGGDVLNDLRFGPQRVLGPQGTVGMLEPGARLRLRATYRPGWRELFVLESGRNQSAGDAPAR